METKTFKRKEKIEKILIEKDFEDYDLMLFLLKKGKLDNIIQNLDDEKTIVKNSSLIENEFLSSEEQFIDVLSYFMYKIDIEFWFLGRFRKYVIEKILSYKDDISIIYSKKYIHDKSNYEYFDIETKKLIIINFYRILLFINDNKIINKFFKSYKINIKELDLNNPKDVENFYVLMRLIVICNYQYIETIFIFDNKFDEKDKIYFETLIENMIKKTYKLRANAIPFLEFKHY